MDTTTLKARRPWYSLEYNDNISALTVAPWSMTDISAYLVSHQVGQKQYELTNHLGNVQATVSDLPYAGGEYYITRKAPALPAVYDYYPFGVLMPGRYTSDTTGKCMTISQTKWVTRWADSCYLAEERMTATLGGATWNTTGGTLNGTSTASNAGLILQVNGLIPDVAQELSFEFEDVMSGAPQIWVSEEQNGIEVSLGSVLVHGKGTTTLTVKPKFGPVHVTLLGPFTFKMKKVCVKVPQLIQQEMLVDVCSDMKDRYRFGFNGQEKTNEWAGLGNHNTAEFWEYDTRVGRRFNLDPEFGVKSDMSPFAVNANSPIWAFDPLGNLESTHTDNQGNVVAVMEDGDKGIYKHDGNFQETKKEIEEKYSWKNIPADGTKMGETLVSGSFLDKDNVPEGIPKGKIEFGSWEGNRWIIAADRELKIDFKAAGGDKTVKVILYALQGGNGGRYDFKSQGNGDYWRGSQISKGVYASARDFGNWFAGHAAQKAGMDKKQFLRTAGAFNLGDNSKFKWPFYFGDKRNVWPSYGEKGISNVFQRLGYEHIITPASLKANAFQIFFSDNEAAHRN